MTRLPNPGQDAGAWGTILNDFLSVEHNSDGTLKASGSLAAKADDNTVTHLAGSETIVGNKNFTGVLQRNGNSVVDTTDPRLGNQSSSYPAQGYGFFSTSDTVSIFMDDSTMTSGAAFFVRMWVPAGQAINAVGIVVQQVGTVGGGGENRFGVYDDAGTLLGQTPSDNTLWSTAPGWATGTFSTPLTAQTNGRFVYAAFTVNGYSSDPRIIYHNTNTQLILYGGRGVTNRRLIFSNGLSALPNSFNPASYGSNTTFLPLIGLG
jgi:hypothetical protein